MAPPPVMKGAFLSTRNGPSGPHSRFTAPRSSRPTRNEPLKATEPVRGETAVPSPPVHEGVTPDEQRLDMAYHVYLQQLVLNRLCNDVAQFQSRVDADQLTERLLDSEVVTGLTIVKQEMPYNLLIAHKIEYLMKTKKFVEIYKELEDRFHDEKSGTMVELQRALEAKFNEITLTNLNFEDSSQDRNVDLGDLIVRIREHLAPQEKSLQDGKFFLSSFIDTFKELLKLTKDVESNKRCAEEVRSSLMDVTSLDVSSNMIKREANKQKKIIPREN